MVVVPREDQCERGMQWRLGFQGRANGKDARKVEARVLGRANAEEAHTIRSRKFK